MTLQNFDALVNGRRQSGKGGAVVLEGEADELHSCVFEK
jgi:hypothetical protein